jgi:hypothetical protein
MTHAIAMPANVRCRDGRAVLCVEGGRLDNLPDDLREEIESIDVSGVEAYLRANPALIADEDEDSTEPLVSTIVRAMMWLSKETGGPVSYWDHAGDHGLIGEEFIGVGPFAMWKNDEEDLGDDGDESKPRSAYTAALWHIGAKVANVNENDSMRGIYRLRRVPLAAWSAESRSFADRRQYPRDVSALTYRMNQLFNAVPANEDPNPSPVAANWIARLKKIFLGDWN